MSLDRLGLPVTLNSLHERKFIMLFAEYLQNKLQQQKVFFVSDLDPN